MSECCTKEEVFVVALLLRRTKKKKMNRIDRLTAILLLLQGGKRTAGEIAQRFEVSRRTILRDIDALCEMGIPIAADLGAPGSAGNKPVARVEQGRPPLRLQIEGILSEVILTGERLRRGAGKIHRGQIIDGLGIPVGNIEAEARCETA